MRSFNLCQDGDLKQRLPMKMGIDADKLVILIQLQPERRPRLILPAVISAILDFVPLSQASGTLPDVDEILLAGNRNSDSGEMGRHA